jgi:hypothetical protein
VHQREERRVKLPLKPQRAKPETFPAQYANSKRNPIMMGECTGHKRTKSRSRSRNLWKKV